MDAAMAVEAVRAAMPQAQQQIAVDRTADPAAVAAFSDAMGVAPVTDVPFASQVQAAWNASQVSMQDHLHRMTALSDLALGTSPSLLGMTQLQYVTATAGFQLEVTTLVAKKSSDAVSTLVKNG